MEEMENKLLRRLSVLQMTEAASKLAGEILADLERKGGMYLYSWRINPNDKYYQIPSKSQFPNPKEGG
jgi:predicted nucleic acid-binding protein